MDTFLTYRVSALNFILVSSKVTLYPYVQEVSTFSACMHVSLVVLALMGWDKQWIRDQLRLSTVYRLHACSMINYNYYDLLLWLKQGEGAAEKPSPYQFTATYALEPTP